MDLLLSEDLLELDRLEREEREERDRLRDLRPDLDDLLLSEVSEWIAKRSSLDEELSLSDPM